MSIPRLTQIFENNLGSGWTSKKVTASGVATETVKASAGKVAMLYVTSAENVTLKDDAAEKWGEVNNATVDWSACPIQCSTSIKLTFGAAATAWIVYK